MIPTFGVENLRLLCTDTDSLCYEIKQEQGSDYEDIWKKIADRDDTMMVFFVSYFFFVSIKNLCLQDFSNFPEDHDLYSNKKAFIPGYFKVRH